MKICNEIFVQLIHTLVNNSLDYVFGILLLENLHFKFNSV
jgi:hypothetical protein